MIWSDANVFLFFFCETWLGSHLSLSRLHPACKCSKCLIQLAGWKESQSWCFWRVMEGSFRTGNSCHRNLEGESCVLRSSVVWWRWDVSRIDAVTPRLLVPGGNGSNLAWFSFSDGCRNDEYAVGGAKVHVKRIMLHDGFICIYNSFKN